MVLLSAAIVFAGLGWLGLSGSDDSGASEPVTASTPAAPTAAAAPPASAAPSAPATSPAANPSTSSASPTTTISAAAMKLVPVRVYNNSTVEGLASTTADKLRTDGWNITDVSNYDSGQIPRSTVFYSPAAGEREAADKLAQSLGFAAEPRFEGIVDAPPGVIVILAGNGGN